VYIRVQNIRSQKLFNYLTLYRPGSELRAYSELVQKMLWALGRIYWTNKQPFAGPVPDQGQGTTKARNVKFNGVTAREIIR
jgi:hypothetical protein